MYIYVAGRGHSGSTILDIMLGGGSAIESVGELGTIGTRGLSGDKTGHLCGCGAVIAECPFWTRVREAVEARCGPASFPTLIARSTTSATRAGSRARSYLPRQVARRGAWCGRLPPSRKRSRR